MVYVMNKTLCQNVRLASYAISISVQKIDLCDVKAHTRCSAILLYETFLLSFGEIYNG